MLWFGQKRRHRPPLITRDAPPPRHVEPSGNARARAAAPLAQALDGPPPCAAAANNAAMERAGAEPSNAKLKRLADDLALQLTPLLEPLERRLVVRVDQLAHDHQTAVSQQIAALGETLHAGLAAQVEALGRTVQDALGRQTKALLEKTAADLTAESARRWAAFEQRLVETCSETAQRATQRPVIEALVALQDRIRQEAAFASGRYRQDADLVLHLGGRRLQEWTDSALHSYAAEVLRILHSLGVELIIGRGGPFDPHHQHVAGVETTGQPELDGHVARILRAGFTWHGSLFRPEEVVVFKMERKNHEKGN